MKHNVILVYNKKKNSWNTLEFSNFNDFKKFLLDLIEKKENKLTEPMFEELIISKEGSLAFRVLPKYIRLAWSRIPRLACILNTKGEIYYFFKRMSSKKLEEFIEKLRGISDKKINEKLKKEMRFELIKNLSQVVEFLNYITYIPEEKIRKEMKIFLEEHKREAPEIIKKFINEIKKIPNAIPPSLKEEKKFNQWWIQREKWLNEIKKRIQKRDIKAKEELTKAAFTLAVAKANEIYGNTPVIFLNFVRLAYLDLLKEAKKFDWQEADVEHFYFDVGFLIRDIFVTIIDRHRVKEAGRFPYALASRAILRMPEEAREISKLLKENKTKNKSS